jgi:hypothetical protein
VVVARRRWPDPESGLVIDRSIDLGPSGPVKVPTSQLGAVGVGHMAPTKSMAGLWTWTKKNGGTGDKWRAFSLDGSPDLPARDGRPRRLGRKPKVDK